MATIKIKVSYHFYLHHTPTKTLIEKLSWTQMNALCRTFRTAEWGDWQIWVAEVDTWFHLKDLIQEILQRSDGLFRKPPVPKHGAEGNTLEHQLVNAPTDLREHVRYKVKLPVMIDVTGSLINTFTEDISLSGIRLSSLVPLRKEIHHCYIYYRSGNELLEFKSKPFYEEGDSLSFRRVRILSCNQLDIWQQTIDRAAKNTQ